MKDGIGGNMLIGRNTIGTCAFMGGVMSIPTPFITAWQKMIEYNDEYLIKSTERIFYTSASVSYHSFARNSLVDQMMGDFLLQLDTDIIFEPDVLARMLLYMDRYDLDVMIAPYVYKSEPHPPVMYGFDPKKKDKFIIGDWDKDADLMQIRGAGAGCLLTRRKVFDAIRMKLNQSPFDIYYSKKTGPLSEDHSFFERCWKLKIPVYASPKIAVQHLTYKSLDINKDYDKKSVLISKKRITYDFSEKNVS